MLGLSTGLTHPDYTTSLTAWTDVSGLVAHYDFSDASKLKQNSNGTTAVSSNNDPIGYAENLVSNGLGTFVRSWSNSGRPLYKTGGANSKSYALFDGSSGCGLVAGVKTNESYPGAADTVYGGISASAYSDITLWHASISLFIVCTSDVEDISGGETIINIAGDDGDGTENFIRLEKYYQVDKPIPFFYYGGDPNQNSPVSGGVWTTEDRLMSIVSAPGTDATSLQVDDTTASTLTLNGNEKLEMTNSNGNVKFNLGAYSNSSLNPNAANWEGKIYEVLLYNRSVTDAEKTLIKNYINTKYDLWS